MLGKIFGKSFLGSFFDKIGMSWMNNVMSLAVNVMTGNWLAAAGDIFSLVSQFSNSWMSRVARTQPLGPFGSTSCFGGDTLSTTRTDEIMINARRGNVRISRRASSTLTEVREAVQNRTYANTNLQTATMSGRV